MKYSALVLTTFLVPATAAYAVPNLDKFIVDMTAAGYRNIEIEQDGDNIKVEAYGAGLKYEFLYDSETGELLKSESRAATDEDDEHDEDDDETDAEDDEEDDTDEDDEEDDDEEDDDEEDDDEDDDEDDEDDDEDDSDEDDEEDDDDEDDDED